MKTTESSSNVVSEAIYQRYLELLLNGDRVKCGNIVDDLLAKEIALIELYTHLFQRSLYEIGELWERNRISVAREHLVTSLTEGLLTKLYPILFEQVHRKEDKAIISCAANEFHQVGGKMAADILELEGWNTYFLGATTPTEELLKLIEEIKPQMVGLSLSIYFNLPALKECIEATHSAFPNLEIIVGGQAFLHGGKEVLSSLPSTNYVPSLEELRNLLRKSP